MGGALEIAQRGKVQLWLGENSDVQQLDGVGLVQWGISKWLNSEGLSIHKGLVARRQKGLSEEVAESICVGQIYL